MRHQLRIGHGLLQKPFCHPVVALQRTHQDRLLVLARIVAS